METPKILSKVLHKKEVKDYTYAILFFIISSFFAVAVIQPTLSKAFSLAKESQDYQVINDRYEDNVIRIIDLQRKLEEIRVNGQLIDVAIPHSPFIQDLIILIERIALQEGVVLDHLDIKPVKYIPNEGGELRTITFTTATEMDYPTMKRFIQRILSTRRLMQISSFNVRREVIGENESEYTLTMTLEISGYHL